MHSYMSALSIPDRAKFAAKVGTTVDYLMHQVGGGHRRASPELAKRIEKLTQGKVSRRDLRPDIYEAA